jgi:hypothetical protein
MYRHGDFDHLVGAGELEVEIGPNASPQDRDVGILDMTTVFPEMRSDPVHPHSLADKRRFHGVGLISAPRLSQGGDVVNVHV